MTEEQVAGDLARAMKAREMTRVYVLRGLLSAIKHLRVEKRGAALRDDEISGLVQRELRKREEAEAFAVKAGRQDLVAQNQAERAVLAGYAPAPLDVREIESAIREIAADPTARSLAAVMGGLRSRFAGRLDGRQASELARRVLAELGDS